MLLTLAEDEFIEFFRSLEPQAQVAVVYYAVKGDDCLLRRLHNVSIILSRLDQILIAQRDNETTFKSR